MSSGELLGIEPLELRFAFELKKQISCSLQLSNKTDDYIAFKVKTTSPKKYCVRPNTGIVLPRSTCDVTVTMQAQREAPPDMQCKDKFLVQSVITNPFTLVKDITPEMFSKESDNTVDEVKLRVLYVSPPQPPSPVHEGSEEGSSPRPSVSDNGNTNTSEFVNASRAFAEPQEKSSETTALITRLNEEKNSAIQQNKKLQQELVTAISSSPNKEKEEEAGDEIKDAPKQESGEDNDACVWLVFACGYAERVIHQKVMLKLDLHDDKAKQKAMKAVSTLSGIDFIGMDMKEQKLMVIGSVDPVDVVSKLRKNWHAEIFSVGPAKEPEKKEEPKKEEPKKEEPKKEEPKKEVEKKDVSDQMVSDLVKAYQAYNPQMTTYYYVQSAEENPNSCVIC